MHECREWVGIRTGDAALQALTSNSTTESTQEIQAITDLNHVAKRFEEIKKSLSVNIQTRLQYGFTPLFSFEEFSGGNYTIGRGYDPATVIGDSGAAARFELRGPRLGITSSRKLVVQPYGFGDAAWAWDRNVPTNSTNRNPQRLISVGGGIRADLSNRFRLDLSVAVPTERAGLQIKRGGPRVLLSLTTRLLPWRK